MRPADKPARAAHVTDAHRAYFFSELDRIGVRAFFADMLRAEHLATLDDVIGEGKEQHVCRARSTMIGHLSDHGWSVASIAFLFARSRKTVEYTLQNRARLDGRGERR